MCVIILVLIMLEENMAVELAQLNPSALAASQEARPLEVVPADPLAETQQPLRNEAWAQEIYQNLFDEKVLRTPDLTAPYHTAHIGKHWAWNLIDAVFSVTGLIQGVCFGDFEQAIDSALDLAKIPITIISSIEKVLRVAVVILIGVKLTVTLLVLSIIGQIVAVVELAVESIKLLRQIHAHQDLRCHGIANLIDMLTPYRMSSTQPFTQQQIDTIQESSSKIKAILGDEKGAELIETVSNIDSRTENLTQITQDMKAQLIASNLLRIHTKHFALTTQEVDYYRGKCQKRSIGQTSEQLQEALSFRCEYELKEKRKLLCNRIAPWMVDTLGANLKPAVAKILSEDPVVQNEGIIEGRELIAQIDSQSKKHLLIYTVGVIGLAILTATFFLGVCAFPPVGLAVLGTVTSVLLTVRGYSSLLRNVDGWHFDLLQLAPEWLKPLAIRLMRTKYPNPDLDGIELMGPKESELIELN
ncbi:MAG: hypothetical protein S4CHLAM102_03290 [Chlamydiia bacterium]|nr:hypothetical protein [Chlamydiia bacterium]